MSILNKIKNMIKMSRISNDATDSGLDQIAQCEYMGRPVNVQLLAPYGISSNPPKNTNVCLLNIGGSSESMAGIPSYSENRFKRLKPWELKIGNYKAKCYAYFKDDGSIELRTGADGGDFVLKDIDGKFTLTIDEDGGFKYENDQGADITVSSSTGKVSVNGNNLEVLL